MWELHLHRPCSVTRHRQVCVCLTVFAGGAFVYVLIHQHHARHHLRFTYTRNHPFLSTAQVYSLGPFVHARI
ncbi:hypothetical protein BD309DRAFT_955225 [Dichomitus squalens]|nr:hypothetical protein BD309DRAFT_955225 [Dichomitus squalens]